MDALEQKVYYTSQEQITGIAMQIVIDLHFDAYSPQSGKVSLV